MVKCFLASSNGSYSNSAWGPNSGQNLAPIGMGLLPGTAEA